MRTFVSIHDVQVQRRANEHGGTGCIAFRRVMSSDDFTSPIDFVDYSVVPPGTSIGRHTHVSSDELYFVVDGEPLVTIDDRTERLRPGAIAVVHRGSSHELVNDTSAEVTILVIQVQA